IRFPGTRMLVGGTVALLLLSSACETERAALGGLPESPVEPPPSSGGEWKNEPAGMTLVTDYGFPPLDGEWRYQRQDAPGGTQGYIQIAKDATAPLGPDVLEFVFPQGFTAGGYSPGAMRPPSIGSGRKELYWGFYWKASPEWQNHSSNINKILFGWMNDSSPFLLTWHWGREFNKGLAFLDQ